MKYCKCGNVIHPLRLKILPSTKTCVDCSKTDKVSGIQVWTHKTGSITQITNAAVAEEIRKMGQREGYGSNLGKFK